MGRKYELLVGKESIRGLLDLGDVVKRNLQLRNFWTFLASILHDSGLQLRDTGGTIRTYNYGDVDPNLAQLVIGQGTDPPAFSQYNLVSFSKAYSPTVQIVDVAGPPAKTRITLTATADIDAQEIGIRQNISGYNFLLTRIVDAITIGDVLNYHLDFLQPWLKNFALLWYGKLSNQNVQGVVDVTGGTRTLRTQGQTTVGSIRILISEDTITWSPTLYAIPNATEITSYQRAIWVNDNYVVYLVLGEIIPATTLNINTIGIVQKWYDTGGNQFDALLAAIPLSSPLTLEANKHNFIMLKFVFH